MHRPVLGARSQRQREIARLSCGWPAAGDYDESKGLGTLSGMNGGYLSSSPLSEDAVIVRVAASLR